MQTALIIVGLLIIALLSVCAAAFIQKAINQRGTKLFANIAEGQNLTGHRTYLADAVQTLRFALVKIGTDAQHMAIAGAADVPIGVCFDEPAAIGDPADVHLIGCGEGTTKMVASAAITAGDQLMPAASGKVATYTAGHYIVGIALTAAAADGDVIEVAHCLAWYKV